MKFKEYVWYWYTTYRKPKQRPISQVSTMSILRNHIDGTSIAEMELSDIRTRDLQEYLTDRKLHGKHTSRKVATNGELSNHMMIKIRQIVIAVFEQAVREDLVRKNYAKETSPYTKPWGSGVYAGTSKEVPASVQGEAILPRLCLVLLSWMPAIGTAWSLLE